VAKDNRNVVNAVWYVAKTGVARRDLPDRFGTWDTVYHRFNGWCQKGVWQRVREAVQDPDREWLLLDSTVIRAHPHAAGMNTAGNDQALGYSRGGFGTKIHVAVDALGYPVVIGPGRRRDARGDPARDLEPGEVLGDKGYDSDDLAARIAAGGAEVVIPPRGNRKEPREYDRVLYNERNKVERYINLLKQCWRAATRYEKTARNFLGMVTLAAITIWLR
jgi:transposase